MEVIYAHGSEHRDDDVVVAEVCVKGTAEREVVRVVGDCGVHRGV